MNSTLNQPDFMDWLFPKPVNPKLHGIPNYELGNPKLKVQDFLTFTWEPLTTGEYNRINFLVRMCEQEEWATWKILRFKSQQSFRARLNDQPVSQAQTARQVKNGTRKAITPRPEIETKTTYEHMAEIVSGWLVGRRATLSFLTALRDRPEELEGFIRSYLRIMLKTIELEGGDMCEIDCRYSPLVILEHFKVYFAEEIAYLPSLTSARERSFSF